jgi:hypothetical protein
MENQRSANERNQLLHSFVCLVQGVRRLTQADWQQTFIDKWLDLVPALRELACTQTTVAKDADLAPDLLHHLARKLNADAAG